MNIDHLYQLLPAIYRERDLGQGAPLQMLLRIVTEQASVIEQDIAQMYENWFIETCQEWVVPYLGDLVGYRPVHAAGEQVNGTSRSLEQVLFPRREVANTIGYRRRKGTLQLLEEISGTVTGWPTRVVETDRLRSVAQAIDYLRLDRGRTVDLRNQRLLDAAGTPFARVSVGVDLRSHDSGAGAPVNGAGLTVFAWRMRAYPVVRTPAYCLEEAGDHCFLFSISGSDVPLYNEPKDDVSTTSLAEVDLPVAITRSALEEVPDGQPARRMASELFYGEGKSIAIWAGDWAHCDPRLPVPAEKIIPADLSDWTYRPEMGHIALDPELGRLAFPPAQLPEQVSVNYSYGFAADLGGGTYPRERIEPTGRKKTYYVGKAEHFRSIHTAYEAWRKDAEEARAGAGGTSSTEPLHGNIEIMDSSTYEERLHLELGENDRLVLRAAPGTRPSIFLADWHSSQPDALTLIGAAGSEFVLDGLLISGRGIELRGDLRAVTIRHSTLVPGWFLHADGRPKRPGEPSITLRDTSAALAIHHSILGPIRVIQEDERAAPFALELVDSILDAMHTDQAALSSSEGSIAPVLFEVRRSTVIGEVRTHAISAADTSIFTGRLTVARRQTGCLRFCSVPAGSRTPRRFQCQPDLVTAKMNEAIEHEALPDGERAALIDTERRRVQPEFLSTRFGDPDYCRLADTNAPEILIGAEDESELGVFHDLFQPQREANLRARLNEYIPAGTSGTILFAS